jgi:hypothetical protein
MKKKKVVRRRRKKALPKQYKAPKGSSREKKLRRTAALYKAGRKQEAFKLREEMEKKERAKKSKKKSTRKKGKAKR